MGRSYAGILGPLAFLTEILHGLSHGGGSNSTIASAIVALFAFATIGFVLGELAAWIVDDSVRSRLAAELAAAKPSATAAKPVVTPTASTPATTAPARPAAVNPVRPASPPTKPAIAPAPNNAAKNAAAAKPNTPATAAATK